MASSEHVSQSDCVHIIPKLVIVEPPASSVRYRYECERGSASSIKGASSTPKNKTCPKIKVVGYQGSAYVQISCVTKDAPYRPHPHNLVGRSDCVQGICCIEIPQDSMTVEVSHLGIQRVKKSDMVASLKLREELDIDPFRTGFSHARNLSSVDIKTVRLCFQVFLKDDFDKSYPLSPIVTEPIEDEKDVIHLKIMGISDCVCFVDDESKKIILLCDKIINADIQIRFFEEQNGELIWESFGDFTSADIHKQVAITFRPPKYRNLEITEPVKVFVELRRPSNGDTSEPIPFEYLPKRKVRRKYPKLHPTSDVKGCHRNLSEVVQENSGLYSKVATRYQTESIRLPSMSTSILSKWNKVLFRDKFELSLSENSHVLPGMNNFNTIDRTSSKQAFKNRSVAHKLNIVSGENIRTQECSPTSCLYSLVPEDGKTHSQYGKHMGKKSFICGDNYSKNYSLLPAEIDIEVNLENDVAKFCLDSDPNYSSVLQSQNLLQSVVNTDPSGISTSPYPLTKDSVDENTFITDDGLQRDQIALNLDNMYQNTATTINDINFDPLQFDFKSQSMNQSSYIDETCLLSAACSSSSNLKSFKVNTDDEFNQRFTENGETTFENTDLQQQIIEALIKKFD